MKRHTVDLTGTTVYGAVALYGFLYSVVSLGIYILLLVMLVLLGLSTQVYAPLSATCLFIFLPLLVLHAYLRHQFMEETERGPWGKSDADLLSFRILRNLKEPEHALLEDLVQAAIRTQGGTFVIRELGLKVDDFLVRAQKSIADTVELNAETFLPVARLKMKELKRPRIDAGVILYTLFEHEQTFRDILHESDLSIEDMRSILQWEKFHRAFETHHAFLSPSHLLERFGGVGRQWIMGYTSELDRLTDDIGSTILWTAKRHVRIHKKELQNAQRVLAKSKLHDLLVIGRVGVGKKTLIENIAYAIRKQERNKFHAFTRILVLKSEELLSGIQNPDEFLLHALNKAQASGRFILIIRDLALILKSGGEKVRAILMKFIREENIQLIGVMSTDDYHQYVKTDSILDHYFEKLTINDATQEETMDVMMEHYFTLSDRFHVHVTYKALRSIYTLSQRYIGKDAFPGKAIEILQDAIALARKAGDTFVEEKHIREIISHKSRMNVQSLSEGDRDKLMRLEDALHSRVVGQTEAVRAVVSALKRARLELGSAKRPIGTFLFLGPTGVGKTHTAKVLAQQYFGSEDAMIRLDMNEFSNEASIAGIVGSAESGSQSYLAQRVQDRPFSLVLLDEIEKAHPKVLHLFLQVLDEGVLTDRSGLSTDFRNTIIIATSNAGALFIRNFFKQHPEFDPTAFQADLVDTIIGQGAFSPEFINRFDETIVFYPLRKTEAEQVAIMMLDEFIQDLQKQKGITIKIDPSVIGAIIEKGYSVEFGARQMRRVILDAIENHIADYMLKNNVKRGETISITRDDLKF